MKTIAIFLLAITVLLWWLAYNWTTKAPCNRQNTDWYLSIWNYILKYNKWDKVCTRYYFTRWYVIYIDHT